MQTQVKPGIAIVALSGTPSVKHAQRLPWIIPAQCEGCGACVNRCPKSCLKMTAAYYAGVEVPWLDDPDMCSGCGLCEKSCAMGAINMTRYTEAARKRLSEKQKILDRQGD